MSDHSRRVSIRQLQAKQRQNKYEVSTDSLVLDLQCNISDNLVQPNKLQTPRLFTEAVGQSSPYRLQERPLRATIEHYI